MDGSREVGQSTIFNSVINQVCVRRMNYWLSKFRGNSLFLLSPWWTCFAVVRSFFFCFFVLFLVAAALWNVFSWHTNEDRWQTLQWLQELAIGKPTHAVIPCVLIPFPRCCQASEMWNSKCGCIYFSNLRQRNVYFSNSWKENVVQ